MEGIDEIMERLHRGETLMIDDQMRSYISIESDDMPKRFVMRTTYAPLEDSAIRAGKRDIVEYEEKRFGSLVEALLSLMDWEWRGIGQGATSNEQ